MPRRQRGSHDESDPPGFNRISRAGTGARMTSRRIFLKSGAMAMLSLGFAPSFLGRAAAAVGAPRKLLIAFFHRGAGDGLNMIVPHAGADYHQLPPAVSPPQPGRAQVGSAVGLD